MNVSGIPWAPISPSPSRPGLFSQVSQAKMRAYKVQLRSLATASGPHRPHLATLLALPLGTFPALFCAHARPADWRERLRGSALFHSYLPPCACKCMYVHTRSCFHACVPSLSTSQHCSVQALRRVPRLEHWLHFHFPE